MRKCNVVLLSLAAIVLFAVVCSIGMRFYYQRKFNQRVAQLKAQGFPVSLDDLEKAYVLPEGAANAADVYIQAFSHYQEPNETERTLLPYVGDYELSEDCEKLPVDVIAAIRVFLKNNEQTLELLDQAAEIEHCLWPRKRDYIWLSCGYFTQIKHAGRLLQLSNLYLAHCGKDDDIVSSLKASIAMSQMFNTQPFLIDYLIGLALKNLAAQSFNEVINRTSLTGDMLSSLQNRIEALQDIDRLYEAFVTDRVCTIEFNNLSYKEQGRTGINPPLPFIRYVNYISGMLKQDMNISLDYFAGFLIASRLPLHERQAAFEAVEAQRNRLSFLHVHLKNSANFAALNDIELRVTGTLRCAETALAIERYRLKNGVLPSALDQLVPEFMDEVRRDPFDDEALRYIVRDVGYTVYTIGEDGVDNGGLSQEQMKKETGQPDCDEYDWPFTVRR